MKNLAEILKEKKIKTGDLLYSRILGTVRFIEFTYTHPIKRCPHKLIVVRAYSGDSYPTNYYYSEDGKLMLNFSGHEYSYEQDLFLQESDEKSILKEDSIEEFQFKPGAVIYDIVDGSTYIFKSYDKSSNTLYYYARRLTDGDLCLNKETIFSGSIKRMYEEFISSDNFRVATDHEALRLFDVLKSFGYQWDAENLEVKKIEKSSKEEETKKKRSYKFVVFDKVLVRKSGKLWIPGFYINWNYPEGFEAVTPSSSTVKFWDECIPYSLETEGLAYTMTPAPEKYVTW